MLQGKASGFSELLSRHAKEHSSKLAFVFLGVDGRVTRQLTYAALFGEARSLASALSRRGLSGKRVLIALPSGLDFVIAFFACLLSGTIAIPVPYIAGRQTEKRIRSIVQDARAIAILTLSTVDDELRASLGDEVRHLPRVFVDNLPNDGVLSLDAPSSGAVAFIQYTSGSVSAPKGVLLTQGNLVANCDMIAQAFGHDETLRGVGWLPLFHDMGLIGHVLQPVFVGGLSVLMSPLTFIQRPIRWLEAISAWQATTSGGPSHGYELCLRTLREDRLEGLNLSSWKVAYCGAEPVRAKVLERFSQRLGPYGFRHHSLRPCYGLAEATLLVTAAEEGEGLKVATTSGFGGAQPSVMREAVSCGRTWGAGKISITDPETGESVSEGTPGEIRVSGPQIGLGYWSGETSTDEAPASTAFASSFPTGDLGFVSDGELYVIGRLKNTIIVLGRKHIAEDIEDTIAQINPMLAALPVAVFAVDVDDRERAVAVQEIVARALTVDDACRAREAVYAAVMREHGLRLDDVVLVRAGTLPRTSSGKVQRSQVRDMYLKQGFNRLLEASPAEGSEGALERKGFARGQTL